MSVKSYKLEEIRDAIFNCSDPLFGEIISLFANEDPHKEPFGVEGLKKRRAKMLDVLVDVFRRFDEDRAKFGAPE